MKKNEKIIYVLWGTIIVFDLLYKTDRIFYAAFGVSIILLLLTLLKNNEWRLQLQKSWKKVGVYFFLFVGYSLTTSFFAQEMIFKIVKNMLIFVAFFLTCFLIAQYTNTSDKYQMMLKTILYSYGMVIIFKFFFNYQHVNIKSQLLAFFNTAERTRYAFGLGHVNDAGLDVLVVMTTTFIYMKAGKVQKEVPFLIVVNIISAVVLLASSCRNALVSLLVFFLIYYALQSAGKKERYFIQILIVLLLVVSAVIAMMFYYRAKTLQQLFMYSGRVVAFDGIKKMISDGKLLFGYGMTNKTDFLHYAEQHNKVFIMDSSYIYYFVHSGLLGSIILIKLLLELQIKLWNLKDFDLTKKRMYIALSVMFLFSGLFETTVLYTGMPISITCTVMILQYLLNGNAQSMKEWSRR